MNKPLYERPSLVRHQPGLLNKFGRARGLQALEVIDGVRIEELVSVYGSPLFVFSESTLVARYRELRDALALRYPKVRIAWSYKTNYLDAICKIMHREGAFAEVVSAFEYEKALHLGVAPSQVHFNGPHKPDAVLELALGAGAMVHIDHHDELLAVERIAARRGIRPNVALRVNVNVETLPAWTRFGFNLENGEAYDAAARLLAGGSLGLGGLHLHIGTFILDPAAYEQAARKLALFANRLRAEHGTTLGFLDLGGGFGSRNTPKHQYLPGEQATPGFSRYVEAIVEGLASLDYPPGHEPTLVLETGRALVDEAGYLVTSVVASKRLPDGRRAIVLDTGVNSLVTAFWYDHEVVPAQPWRGVAEPTVFYGPLCMNIDVMRDTVVFPPVSAGERVVFKNVGAYNVTQWWQFIGYRPAVVLLGRDRRHALMRRRETLEDIVGPERVPEWL